MANILSAPISAPPSTTKVIADFYDDANRKQLLTSPAASTIQGLQLPRTLDVPTVELLTYYLFYKKRPGSHGYANYYEIRNHCREALFEFDGLVDFKNGSLSVVSPPVKNSGTTERLGEAIGLSVVSQIHGLIEADWSKIPETNTRKTLDYEYAASDGNILIKTETKGSIVADNQNKCKNIYDHKADIVKKKKAEREHCYSNLILYGTIAALDDRTDSIAKCWLLDPPTEETVSPEKFRIISRFTAISELVSFISARSQLSTALQTRLASLAALDDINTLNNVPLRRGDGTVFSTAVFSFSGSHNPWLIGKSIVTDGPAGGQVFQMDEKNLFFIGIREHLLVYAVEQSFETILTYKFPSGTVYKTVLCYVPKGRFEREFSSVSESRIESHISGQYVYFQLKGHLHYSSSGLVFGVLPIPD